jgi:AcrR family transcriptional regulator
MRGNLREIGATAIRSRKQGEIIEQTGKKRTRLSPVDRREQLVTIGARLFAERPFSDVWIEQVAEQAGVSRGLVYHYFPNKRDFYTAVVRRGAQDAIRISEPDESLPLLERLRASLDHFLSYVEENENGFRAVYRGQHSADEEIRAVVREGRDLQAARIIEHFNPPGGPSPTLRLALEGWMNFNSAVILDWLETREISREVLLDLMTGALVGITIASLRADGSAELSELLGELQTQMAAVA